MENSCEIEISKSKRNADLYNIDIWKEDEIKPLRIQYNTAEREEFESILIANPEIKYISQYEQSLYAEIINVNVRPKRRMNEMTVRVPIRTEDKKRIFDVEVLIMGDSFQLKDIRLKQRKKEKEELVIPFEEINRQVKAYIAA